MTNFNDRFGGGGLSALGIIPPRPSMSFKDPGTLAMNSALSGKMDTSGRRAPIFNNVYEHLSLPVMLAGGGVGFLMTRGENQGGTPVWSNDFGVDNPTAQSDFFAQAYYYDPSVAENLYWLGHETTGTGTYRSLQKVALSDGTWTEVWNTTTNNTYNDFTSGQVIFPVTPATPDTSDWFILTSQATTPFTMRARKYDSSGTLVTDNPFKVDDGGSNEQEVKFTGGYITEAHDLMMSNVGIANNPAGIDASFMTFSLLRGSTRLQVLLPIDGDVVTSVENAYDLSGIITTVQNTMVTAWGDSVLLLADNTTGSTTDLAAYFGRRMFDRVDWDRWLHAIADFYGMGDREVYFT